METSNETKEVIIHTLQRIRDLVTTRKNLVGAEMSNESVMNVVSVLAKDALEYIDKYWERNEENNVQ